MKIRKEPNYSYLVSWDQKGISQAHVKRDSRFEAKPDYAIMSVKKDIVKSIIIISLVLILELVVYLAWNKFIIK